MQQRILLPLLIVALLLPSTPAPTPVPQAAPQPSATAHPDDADSIVVPDGSPLAIQVMKGYSSKTAKVGDVINFRALFATRVDDVVVIPQGTALTGKVLAVIPPKLGSKDGQVQVALDTINLPGGETATARSIRKPKSPGEKAVGDVNSGVGAALGTLLFGTYFQKGYEQVVTPGAVDVVYLNGPVRVSRKAAMQAQPATGFGFAFVVSNGSGFGDVIPNLTCGRKFLARFKTDEILQLELSPGMYWFSVNTNADPSDKKRHMATVKTDILEDHKYSVQLDWRNKLVVKEIKDRFVGNLHASPRVLNQDFSKPTTEQKRLLTAEPVAHQQH